MCIQLYVCTYVCCVYIVCVCMCVYMCSCMGCVCTDACACVVCVGACVKDSVLICLICFLAEAVWLQSIKFKTQPISWINLVLLRLNFRSNWIRQYVLCYMFVIPQTCWSSQNMLFTQETFLGSLGRAEAELRENQDLPVVHVLTLCFHFSGYKFDP